LPAPSTFTQKAAAILRQNGRIVNLSSVSGQMGLLRAGELFVEQSRHHRVDEVSAREFARQNITSTPSPPDSSTVGMSKECRTKSPRISSTKSRWAGRGR